MRIFLQKQSITEELYLESKIYFKEKYLKELWEKANLKESLVSRYLISKIFENKFWIKYFEPKTDNFWKPIFENDLFWSISHKDNLIFVWISDFKIWLDIETIKNRDENLLNIFSLENYNLLWWKSWKSFCILWTAKESIIKYRLINFEDINIFELLKVVRKINKFCEITFVLELLVNCDWVEYIIYSWTNSNEIFSLGKKKIS